MNIVSFGGSTNSAALLIGLYKHKIPIDLITFADVYKRQDLTKIKSKVMFNLTKRQLLCFGAAVAIGLPLFFLTKDLSLIHISISGKRGFPLWRT